MNLNDHIKNKTLTLGVIGLGYVGLPREMNKIFHRGLPLAVEFANAGLNVVGSKLSRALIRRVAFPPLVCKTKHVNTQVVCPSGILHTILKKDLTPAVRLSA